MFLKWTTAVHNIIDIVKRFKKYTNLYRGVPWQNKCASPNIADVNIIAWFFFKNFANISNITPLNITSSEITSKKQGIICKIACFIISSWVNSIFSDCENGDIARKNIKNKTAPIEIPKNSGFFISPLKYESVIFLSLKFLFLNRIIVAVIDIYKISIYTMFNMWFCGWDILPFANSAKKCPRVQIDNNNRSKKYTPERIE